MDRPELFDGAWLKWGWAVRHAEALERDIEALTLHNRVQRLGLVTRTDYHAQRHCIVISVASVNPVPARLGLGIGDVAHNYRSCLDYLAWALVCNGKTPPDTLTKKRRNAVYFPLAGSRKEFNASLADRYSGEGRLIPAKLPGLRRVEIAKVRRHQPYQRGVTNLPRHPLTLLGALANRDKHRTIQPVWSLPMSGVCEVSNFRDCVKTRMPKRTRRYPLEVGAEIGQVYVRRTGPHPDCDVHCELEAEPALNERILVGDWMTETSASIAALLREFTEPPQTLWARLDSMV